MIRPSVILAMGYALAVGALGPPPPQPQKSSSAREVHPGAIVLSSRLRGGEEGAGRGHAGPSTRVTGIIVHGCHLHTDGWERIVFGDPSTQELGRVSQAALLMLEEDPVCVVFGTGGSEKDGKREGDFTRDYLLENFQRLALFNVFAGIDLGRLERLMRERSVAETTSRNTVEELERGADILREHRIERLILVSSPTHLPRCLRDACVVYGTARSERFPWAARLLVCPSGTSYTGAKPEDVAVVEPPHRGDRDRNLDRPMLGGIINRLYAVPPRTRRGLVLQLEKQLETIEGVGRGWG